MDSDAGKGGDVAEGARRGEETEDVAATRATKRTAFVIGGGFVPFAETVGDVAGAFGDRGGLMGVSKG